MEKEKIINALRKVRHPELNNDLVSLEMVSHISVNGYHIKITLLFKKPVDPLANSVKKSVISTLQLELGKQYEIEVENVFPHHDIKEKVAFKGIKNIVAVASGKGGVGKSTVAVNLAVSLALQGYKVGLLDADIFGPSIPKMFGVENEKPGMVEVNGESLIEPIEKFGVKLLSVGFFVDPSQALVWRGPMATSALKQLMEEANWGHLDIVLIDMPPGTSDIHLTVVQSVAVNGAVVVTTPQEVALADAIKGINMFRSEAINVPVLGLVENMAWFTPAELSENKYYLFGKGGGERLAKKLNVPLLGQIPIVQSICDGGDSGMPVSLMTDRADGMAFQELAKNMMNSLNERNKKEATKKVEITNK